MLELNGSMRSKKRAPSADKLVEALRIFFKAKSQKNEPILELQAKHVRNTLLHLRQTISGGEGFGLPVADLRQALIALAIVPEHGVETHKQLSRMLFAEIKRKTSGGDGLASMPDDDFPLATVLARTGDARAARQIVYNRPPNDAGTSVRSMWEVVLKGFVAEHDQQELEVTLAMMADHDIRLDQGLHELLVVAHAQLDDRVNTMKWYARPRVPDGPVSQEVYRQVIKCCIRMNDVEWGDKMCQFAIEAGPVKKTWDVLFQWAAVRAQDVEELDRKMHVMVQSHQGDDTIRPDTDTFNGLLELAGERNDVSLTEHYWELSQKWDVLPNSQTFLIQMDHRIKAGDLAGATAAYNELRAEGYRGDADIALGNKLLQAAMASTSVAPEDIISIERDMRERKARLQPDTLAALAFFHLRRDELRDVIGLLKEQAFHYSMSQRERCAELLFNFIRDRSNSTELVWDAYTITIHTISELPGGKRMALMKEFFDRARPDMASHVFAHACEHELASERPRVKDYAECLRGISRARDAQSLAMVHNILKLDNAVEPNTRLLNSLMLAFEACGSAERTLQFWQDISRSREGPSYSSILIALRACESTVDGYDEAMDVLTRVNELGIEMTHELAAAFIGAIAAHDSSKEASRLIKTLDEKEGMKPDALMLVYLFVARLCQLLSRPSSSRPKNKAPSPASHTSSSHHLRTFLSADLTSICEQARNILQHGPVPRETRCGRAMDQDAVPECMERPRGLGHARREEERARGR